MFRRARPFSVGRNLPLYIMKRKEKKLEILLNKLHLILTVVFQPTKLTSSSSVIYGPHFDFERLFTSSRNSILYHLSRFGKLFEFFKESASSYLFKQELRTSTEGIIPAIS